GGSAGHSDMVCLDHTARPWAWALVDDDTRTALTPGGAPAGPKKDRVKEGCDAIRENGPMTKRSLAGEVRMRGSKLKVIITDNPDRLRINPDTNLVELARP